MEKISKEDLDLRAILEMNLDDIDQLGIEDSSFVDKPAALPMTLEKRMEGSNRLARLQALWDKGIADNPSGLPMSRGMENVAAMERTVNYKTMVLKVYDSAVAQVHDYYDQICLGEMTDVNVVGKLVGNFLDILEKDRNVLLALCLYQSPIHNDYLYRHSINMSIVSLTIAAASGFSRNQVLEIGTGALLADVGMGMIPEEILNKSGKLSDEELAEIQKHPANSFALLESIPGMTDLILAAAYQHHERITGAGYPKRRAAAQVSQIARIAGIADTLCAMVHKRSHRDALTPQMALDKVMKIGQMNFLDAGLIKNLARYLSVYPIGTFVELASGRIGRVVASHVEDVQKPVVAILRTEKSQPMANKQIQFVDLFKDKNEKIVKVIEGEALNLKQLDGF